VERARPERVAPRGDRLEIQPEQFHGPAPEEDAVRADGRDRHRPGEEARDERRGLAADPDPRPAPLLLARQGEEGDAQAQRQEGRPLRQADVVPNVAMELDSLEATKRMVEEGLGIALVPLVTIERELEAGTLVRIDLVDAKPIKRPISLIHRRHRKRPRTVQAFIDTMAKIYTNGQQP